MINVKLKQESGKYGRISGAIVSFFVVRHPLIHAVTILAVMVGIISYLRMPQEIFPAITTDKVEIRAVYPGTSADTFDDIITSRIEDDVQDIEGVKQVESITRDGSCVITISLAKGARTEDVLLRIRDALDLLKPDFPQDMDDPSVHLVIKKYPLLTLSIDGAEEARLQQVAEKIQDDIQRIPNISAAVINGKAEPEIHIYLKSERLNALGISPVSLMAVIRSSVNNSPLGEIKQQGNHLFITTQGGPKTLKEWQNLIVHVNGKKLYLARVADIRRELSEIRSMSHFNGKRNISITIFKTSDGSSIELSKKIRGRLKAWEKQYQGLHFAVYSDLSVYIKNRLNTVKSSAIVGLILVTLSLYVFLNRGVALVVLMGIPTSFLIAFVYLHFRGESINMLSLFSFLMALGMVVDDAIVVGENIYRHMESGIDRRSAAILGSKEVFWPVSAATFTTVAAFLPLLLLGGDIGRFLSIIPVIVSTVLLASLLEALCILPVHAVECYRSGSGQGFFSNWHGLREIYKSGVILALKRRKTVIGIFAIALAATLLIAKLFLNFILLPDFDTDQIYIRGKLGAKHGIHETEKVVSEIEARVINTIPDEDLESVATHLGTSFNDKMEFDVGEDLFQVFINLKKPVPQNWLERWVYPVIMFGTYERGTRTHSAQDLESQLHKALSDISIKRLEITRPKAGIVRSDIEIGVLASQDPSERQLAQKAAQELKQALANIPGVENAADDLDTGKIEMEIHINHLGRELGFSEAEVASVLKNYYLNPRIVRIMKDVKKDMVVRTYIHDRDDIQVFKGLKLKVPGSASMAYLNQIADIRNTEGQARIWKKNGIRQITVTASLNKKVVTSNDVMEKMKPLFDKFKTQGIQIEIRGEQKVAGTTLHDLFIAGLVAIMGIFIVLLLQFNSLKDSLIVLSSVPFSFIGVVIGHLIMGQHITIPSLLGFIGLCGVAVNDAIIMVDFLSRHSSGQDPLSLADSASLRLRPIILTSVTTFLSLVPLIFFATGQAMILSPMATSFGFGLIAATVTNMTLIPVLYSFKKLK